MPRIQIFDPALCCSSGVCGQDLDARLVQAAADIDGARSLGAEIERFNLAQQPMAFAGNPTVRGLLERSGQDALPITLVDGEVVLAGRYPSRQQLAQWSKTAAPVASIAAGDCCSGGKCC